MTFQNKETKPLRGIFPVESKQELPNVSKEFSAENQFYAVALEEEIIKKFMIILRSGRKFRVPYATLPITELSDKNDALFIMAYQLLIIIKGRNIAPIDEALASESLLWVSESFSEKDDGISPVFISNITIEGKAISKQVD
ncbi:hypothetical protein ACSIGC_08095 [Tenacibaculum sp. ZS6-P6]|uniref:hypothetical protein n=1 Tax=Tenacibaculum sp. ZS6-P6 TaxID=3447503 RepID=UPI003F981A30